MKNKKTLSFIVAFALMVSAATLLISATSALGSGSYAIRFSAEQEGGAGYYREASVIGGSASGKFLVFQVTSGEAEDTAVTVTAIQLSGTSSAIISYQKPDSFVEAWLAEGLPDLAGGGELGTDILAYNNSDTPEPPQPPMPDTDYIKVAQAMIVPRNMGGGVDDITVSAKFKLFNEYDKVVENPPGTVGEYKTAYAGTEDVVNNIWRTGGDNWRQLLAGNQTFAGVEQFELDFGCEVQLFELWMLDGKPYAPATIVQSGDSSYEVIGGKFQIWGLNGETGQYVLLAERTLQNNHEWVQFNLADVYGTYGFNAQKMKFVKISTGNRYSWTGGGWTSDPMYYVCDVCVPEVAIKGLALGHLTEDDPEMEFRVPDASEGLGAVVDHRLPFKKIIGSNTHASDNGHDWVGDGIYAPFGSMREYHNWGWTEYSANDTGTGSYNNDAVTKQSGQIAVFRDLGWWGNPTFEDYYKKCYESGIDVVVCVQGGAGGAATIPAYQADRSKINPASYLAHSQSMFQLAARFGNTVVDASRLSVATGQPKKTGLGYVKYYEDWNEPNATWETLGDRQFSGTMYAAMLSADYDGHMNTMGPNAGVKNADPTAKVVMAGLVGYPDTLLGDYENRNDTLRFMYDMINWFQANRTEEKWYEAGNPAGSWDPKLMYPFDVVNGHHYSPDGNTTGCSPEENDVYGRMTRFVDFCHEYFPWCEVWLSEFGWETGVDGKSPQSATAESTGSPYAVGINKGLTTRDVQGRWIAREYLILSLAGVDRSQEYSMPNYGGLDSPDTGGRHSRDGFFNTGEGVSHMKKSVAKDSWWYVAAMSNVLGDMTDSEVLNLPAVKDSPTDPWVVKYTPDADTYDGGTDAVYALWLGSSKGDVAGTLADLEGADGQIGYDSTRVVYDLEVGADVTEVTFVHLKDQEEYGVYETVPVVNGKVQVIVTERPVFVAVGEVKQPPVQAPRIWYSQMTITPFNVYGWDGWANDEVNTWGDILAGDGYWPMRYVTGHIGSQGNTPPHYLLYDFRETKIITDIASYYMPVANTTRLEYCVDWSDPNQANWVWAKIDAVDYTSGSGDWQGAWNVFKGLEIETRYIRLYSISSLLENRLQAVAFWGWPADGNVGEEKYSLSITAGTGGTVSGTQSGIYAAGLSVSVTAVPNSGYEFAGWTANGVTLANNSANPAAFAMPAHGVSLTANFTPVTTPPPPPSSSERIWLSDITWSTNSLGTENWETSEKTVWGDLLDGSGPDIFDTPGETNMVVWNGTPVWALFDFGTERDVTDLALYYRSASPNGTVVQYCTDWSSADQSGWVWAQAPGIDLSVDLFGWRGGWQVVSGLSVSTRYIRIYNPGDDTGCRNIGENRVFGIAFWAEPLD